MPDISMCLNKDCPRHRECYRFMAIPDRKQGYSHFVNTDGTCDYFIAIEEGMKTKKIEEKENED